MKILNSRQLSKNTSCITLLCIWLLINILSVKAGVHKDSLGFIPLIGVLLIPGYLLLKLILRKTSIDKWAALGLSVCLSITLLMAEGLLLNSLLPLLGMSRPLSFYPILIEVDIVFIALLAAVMGKRNVQFHLPLPSKRTALSTLALSVLPLLAAGGAIRINNGGSAIVSIALILLVSLVGLAAMIVRKLPDWLAPVVLLMLAAATLFLWSLRSMHIPAASDLGTENFVFNLTSYSSHWSIGAFRDPYNACLSITILPTMMSRISSYSGVWIYKLWFPMIFSIIAPMLYVFFKRVFNKRLAFTATFFFITQSVFMYWMPMLARQEISMLYLAAIFLVLYGLQSLTNNIRKVLLGILFLSLIVSHYSTAYIVLFVFGVSASAQWLLLRWKRSHQFIEFENFVVPGTAFLIAMFLFVFLWQVQVTATGQGFFSVVGNTFSSLISNNGGSAKNVSAEKVFSINPFNRPTSSSDSIISDYQKQIMVTAESDKSASFYPNANKYPVRLINDREIVSKNQLASKTINITDTVVSLLVRLALVIGILALVVGRKKASASYVLQNISFLLVIVMLAVFPYISLEYNIERLYQVALILLAPIIIVGLTYIFKILRSARLAEILVMIICILFFWHNCGLSTQMSGGFPSAILNNFGYYYDQNYATGSDVRSIEWLGKTDASQEIVYADWGVYRSLPSEGDIANVAPTLLPSAISKNSYVFIDRANLQSGVVFGSYNGSEFLYSSPLKFLNQQKNKIYASNEDAIYN